METDFKLNDKIFIVTDDNEILSGLVYGTENLDDIQIKLDNGFIGWFDKSEVYKYYDQAELIIEEKFKSNTQEWNP